MRFLAVDTSESKAFLAAGQWDEPQDTWEEVELSVDASQHEVVAERACRLLTAAFGSADRTEVVVAGIGPGSFTGLRIGLSFCKGLALALQIPLLGISSLQARAVEALKCSGLAVVLSDARRGEVFFGAYGGGEGAEMRELVAPVIVPLSSLEERMVALEAANGGKVTLVCGTDLVKGARRPRRVGAALAVLAMRLKPAFDLGKTVALVPDYLRGVNARTIAERAAGPGAHHIP